MTSVWDGPLVEGCEHELWLMPMVGGRLRYLCDRCVATRDVTLTPELESLSVNEAGRRVATSVGGSYEPGALGDQVMMRDWTRTRFATRLEGDDG